MHILITGAAGMIGGKLTARLGRDGALAGRTIRRMTLVDVVVPQKPAGTSFEVETAASDLAAPGGAAEAIAGRPDVIFHLAAVVSGEAETDFEKGYRVNFAGTRELLEAIRLSGYHPKFVFASSIAVFGAPFPDAIPDDFFLTPLTSYGTQKAIGELLLADYTRRGFLDGVGIRLPSITVRPGRPNKAASGFFSSIIREPLAGHEAILPVSEEREALVRKPARSRGLPRPRCRPRPQSARLADQPHHAGPVLHRRRGDRGAHPRGGLKGCCPHSPRAGRHGGEDRGRLAGEFRCAARARTGICGGDVV